MRHSVNRFLAAIQLTRLTMAFGAVSDLWLVILISRAIDPPDASTALHAQPLGFALFRGFVIAVGLFAYGAGLNDVLDARHDSAFSPERPIPAGRIRVGQAIVVIVGALMLALLASHSLGPWSFQLTLLTAVGILFYNAAGRFIPAVGLIVIGLVHATHMLIPNVSLTFTWPVWFVMTHAMMIALAAHVLEQKRPRITRPALAAIVCGWLFWSGVILAWGITRGGWWAADASPIAIVWPIGAVVGFVFVARWKTSNVPGPVAAEKLRRYGAMWQALYGAMWLLALGLVPQAMSLLALAVVGFTAMTLLKEAMGQMNRPLTWRA